VPSPFWTGARAFAGRLVISIALVSGLTVVGVAAVNRGINDRLENVHHINLVLPSAPPEGANYVILGSDSRAVVDPSDTNAFGNSTTTGGQRSDTLMVAHVEPSAQRTFVVSFPRDLVVDIPGHGKDKINAAYDFGGGGKDGAQLVIDTLQANFPGLKINHFVQVDFRSFQEVVNAIGSVPVYFPLNTRDFDVSGLGDTGFEVKAGCVTLNGDAALQYVRSRHLQTQDPGTGQWKSIDIIPDIARIGRQQAFIRELAGIAISKSLGDPLTALDIADRVQSYLTIDTQFGRDELNQLIRAFRTVDVNDTNAIEFGTVPWNENPSTAFGSSLILKQPDANQMVARLMQFGDKPAPPKVVPSQVRVRVVDSTGKGEETAVEQSLAQQGFVEGGTGAQSTPLTTTDVHYAPNLLGAAKLLLDYFPDARLVPDAAASDRITLVLGTNFAGAITVPTTAPTTTAPPASDAPPATTVQPSTTAPAPTNTPLALGAACTP
jgi:LCP family protein required for cell wall assembly